MAATAVESRYR